MTNQYAIPEQVIAAGYPANDIVTRTGPLGENCIAVSGDDHD